ncbi:MAG: hypothetical protein ACYDHW_15560 [Syntrophorhabdaceae bacterium]
MPVENQNVFLDLLSQRMGALTNAAAQFMPGEILPDSESLDLSDVPAQSGPGAIPQPIATDSVFLWPTLASTVTPASLGRDRDNAEMTVLLSSVISLLDMFAISEGLKEETDLPEVAEFLKNVMDVLSMGDEAEFTARTLDGADESLPDRQPGHFPGSLVPILAALHRVYAPPAAADLPPAQEDASARGPMIEIPDAAAIKMRHAPGSPSGEPESAVNAGKGNDGYAVLVDIAKSGGNDANAPGKPVVGDIKIAGLKPPEDTMAGRAMRPIKTGDAGAMTGVTDLKKDNDGGPDRIIIRIREIEETQLRQDRPGDDSEENELMVHAESLRHGSQTIAPETKIASKNDFGTIMLDRIEKLTEHFAGKNMNADMQVKLKIGDNETILITMRDEGAKVNIEIRGANENTLNYLQSQKDDLVKNLETRNIMATIHVDIDQDAQRRQQQKAHQDRKDNDGNDSQDFGAFFEALA